MPYKCIHGGVVRPCVYDPRYDKNLSEEGKRAGKRRYRNAKKGDELPFVCPVSRKYFVATDEATKRQDEDDLLTINAKLKSLGVNVPSDALVWESAANLSMLEQKERKKKERKPTRKFEKVAVETDSESDDIKARLANLGVKFHPKTGLDKLKILLADAEKKAAPETEEG